MLGMTKSSPERTAKVRAIKDWARESLQLSEEVTVMVTELRCTEPGCPPLETIVAVLPPTGERTHFKMHKCIDEVSYEDVEVGAARMLRGESHER